MFKLIFILLINYTIFYGDKLDIVVWGDESLSGEYVVKPDGKIIFPWTKGIKAVGLTPEQLSDTLSKYLSKYIKGCMVSVSIKESARNRVYIYGEIKAPGVYSFQPDATIWDAINLAGGVTPDANLSHIEIRKGVSIETIDLTQPVPKDKLVLEPHEIIFVPKRLEILVTGAVKNPGRYNFCEGIKILDAITLAGGFAPHASLKSVRVVRSTGEVVKVNINSIYKGKVQLNISLEPGDVVYVPRKKQINIVQIAKGATWVLSPVVTIITIIWSLKNLGIIK